MATGRKDGSKKSSSKKGTKARSSSKRELIKPNADARYIKRDTKGRIKESDDVGLSSAVDRRKKAKKTVKPGHGDQGDQKRKPAKKK